MILFRSASKSIYFWWFIIEVYLRIVAHFDWTGWYLYQMEEYVFDNDILVALWSCYDTVTIHPAYLFILALITVIEFVIFYALNDPLFQSEVLNSNSIVASILIHVWAWYLYY